MDNKQEDEKKEMFATQDTTNVVVGRIFIAIALMVLAFLIAIVLFITYNRSLNTFISVFAGIVFLYSLIFVIIVAVKRDVLGRMTFQTMLGSSAMMCIISLIMIIFFSIKNSSSKSKPSFDASYERPESQAE